MNLDVMMKNIENRTKEELSGSQDFYANRPDVPASATEQVDVYQQNRDRFTENRKKTYPNGASKIVSIAVQSVIDGDGSEGLARAYARAKNESDALAEQGDKDRSEIRRRQYMEEYFLPALEIVVNSSSPDEALNASSSLAELDKYALLPANTSGSGYSASYVRQAYGDQLGNAQGRSDPDVTAQIRRINMLMDEGEIRTACSMASNLKKQIDAGEHIADDVDYDFLGRIVAYEK